MTAPLASPRRGAFPSAAAPPGPAGRHHVVDAHHHLWDPAGRRHAWLDAPALARLNRPFDLSDYRVAVQDGLLGLPVGGTVLVQALADRDETVELLATAAADPLVAAVVGWVDLRRPDLADELARLTGEPGGAHLRGIRHLVQDERDDRWLEHPATVRGLRTVAATGLGYDLLIAPRHLTVASDVVRAVPELTVVVDHGAKPDLTRGHRTPEFVAWADGMRRLASCPQVTVKLSGLITEADWRTWRMADLLPAIDLLLEAFGPDRLMFGSDWPVCLLAGTWQRWARLVGDLLLPLAPAERASILGGTAARVYGGARLAAGPVSPTRSEGNTP